MLDDLNDLYQEVILEHAKSPRNFRELPGANRVAHGRNPLCGDKLRLYLRLEGERIADAIPPNLRYATAAGIGLLLSFIGASIWSTGLAVAGWLLGDHYERIHQYIGPVSTIIVGLALLPVMTVLYNQAIFQGWLLVMLILGGVGRIYGAFVGPAVYMIAQDLLAKQFPEYWYLGIGGLLVLVVLFARGGILGLVDRFLQVFKGRRK